MNKLGKSTLSLTLSAAMLSSIVGVASANPASNSQSVAVVADSTIHNLVPYPPEEVITPFGTIPPFSVYIHNLNNGNYNYTVTKLGAYIYTDKWIQGRSSVSVSIEGLEFTPYGDTPMGPITIECYSSSGLVATRTVDIASGSRSATFSSLNTSTNYYYSFSVPNTGALYKFSGSFG